MNRQEVKRLVPGDTVLLEVPFSEVCISMGVAGQLHEVELFLEGTFPMARIAEYPSVLPAEAGILCDEAGYYAWCAQR